MALAETDWLDASKGGHALASLAPWEVEMEMSGWLKFPVSAPPDLLGCGVRLRGDAGTTRPLAAVV